MLIQASNWIARARRAAGAKGPAQTDLLEDVNQMVQVADLDTPEFDFLGGVKRICATANVPAVAAQNSCVSLFNPAGTGMLAYLYAIELVTSTAVTCTEEVGNIVSGLPAVIPFWEDFRYGTVATGGQSSLQVQAGTTAAFPATTIVARDVTLAATTLFLARRWILPPFSLWVLKTPLNVTITSINLFWKERPAESGELGLGS